MSRKLFCQLSPVTYAISAEKERLLRRIKDWHQKVPFAVNRQEEALPVTWYTHRSLIFRTLGNTQLQLQAGKAVNLSLAVPKVTGIVIEPGEVFSLWRLVGRTSRRAGYAMGLTIADGKPEAGIGGGLCQLSNLIHWMVLHTPMKIVELHHHDQWDLFPDFHRQVPFGTGTSIAYNYLDYRFENTTSWPVQLKLWIEGRYLCGQILSTQTLDNSYHISVEGERFVREQGKIYREGQVYRKVIDKRTGNLLEKTLLRQNHALVLYDTSQLPIEEERG